jgi:DNA-binding transcriptional LysR family regulator
VLAAVDGGREAVAALSGLLTGRLAVGLVQPLPDRRVPRLVGAFRRAHPGIDLALIEGETDALLAALARGEIHAALIGLGRYDRPPPGVESMLVAREPVVVAVHPGHRFAGRASVPLVALRDEPLVTLTSSNRGRLTLESACRAAGFAPRIVAETSDLGLLVDLTAEQIGLAVLPTSALAGAFGVVQVALTRPKLDRRIMLVWRPANRPPAGRAFLALAREHLAYVSAAAAPAAARRA